jgi:acetylornithine deacetylase/succinyl-diaminopimelate desuccinylase-like protein
MKGGWSLSAETTKISELEREILHKIDDGYVVDLLQRLVRIPSIAPPCHLEEIATFVAEEMKSYGLEVVTAGDHGQEWERPNVLATLDGAEEEWGLTLNAHMDVVPPYDLSQWKLDPFAGEIIDGTIYGRGTADTKGSLAAMMGAARAIALSGAKLRKGLSMLAWAGDEWSPPDAQWFNGESYMAAHGFLKPAPYVCGEPYDLKICYISRGRIWFEFKVGGEATHSATGKGVNAILEAIKLIQGVYQIGVGHHPVLGADTINVGTIKGGSQPNMVPDECTMTFDIRFAPPLTTAKVKAKCWRNESPSSSRTKERWFRRCSGQVRLVWGVSCNWAEPFRSATSPTGRIRQASPKQSCSALARPSRLMPSTSTSNWTIWSLRPRYMPLPHCTAARPLLEQLHRGLLDPVVRQRDKYTDLAQSPALR